MKVRAWYAMLLYRFASCLRLRLRSSIRSQASEITLARSQVTTLPYATLTWTVWASRQGFGFLWARHSIDPSDFVFSHEHQQVTPRRILHHDFAQWWGIQHHVDGVAYFDGNVVGRHVRGATSGSL